MALDYKVGDKVKSHPESSDVTGMKAIYIGEIAEVVGEMIQVVATSFTVNGFQ